MKNSLKIILAVLIVTVLITGGIYVFLKSRILTNKLPTDNPSAVIPSENPSQPNEDNASQVNPLSDYLKVEEAGNSALPTDEPKIVFVSDGAIYAGSIDGKVTEKIVSAPNKDYDVRIYANSSNKKWIVVNVWDNQTTLTSKEMLYGMNLETFELFKITENDWESCNICHFISNSDHLVYGNGGVNGSLGYVAVVNLDTKVNTSLLEPISDNNEAAYYFDISPSETYIAYVGGKGGVFPDNDAALWLKNLETGEETTLVKGSGLNPNFGENYLGEPKFINDGKEILYSINTSEGASYFVTDLKGNVRPATDKDLETETSVLESKLKSKLNKNLHINAVLSNCNKIIFTVYNDNNSEELWEADLDGNNAKDLGIANPNVMNFTEGCKFTCGEYLIDLETEKKIDLDGLYKAHITYAIYLDGIFTDSK